MLVAKPAKLDEVDVREGEIVRADDADRTSRDESANNAFRADPTVLRVRSLEQLVQKEQQWERPLREIAQLAQPRDFCIEPRAAFVQRIIDSDAGAYLE